MMMEVVSMSNVTLQVKGRCRGSGGSQIIAPTWWQQAFLAELRNKRTPWRRRRSSGAAGQRPYHGLAPGQRAELLIVARGHLLRQDGPRGQAATLERLRAGRQLRETLARGPDPVPLAAMSGPDPKTAIRYAQNAPQPLIAA